jgi:hypothetical protein
MHASTECSLSSVSSGIDDLWFGNRKDMRGAAFLPALIGSLFISKCPMKYIQPDFKPDLSTVSLMKNILRAEYGVSLTQETLLAGLLKFLNLLSPTSSDTREFRADLDGNALSRPKIIFLKLASAKSEAAAGSAKANPSRNMKRKKVGLDGPQAGVMTRKKVGLDGPQAGVIVDEKLIDRLKIDVIRWAEEERKKDNPVFYWHILSTDDMKIVAAEAPTTMEDLNAIGGLAENIVKEYGNRIVETICDFVKKKRPEESSNKDPCKSATVALTEGFDPMSEDEFGSVSPIDWAAFAKSAELALLTSSAKVASDPCRGEAVSLNESLPVAAAEPRPLRSLDRSRKPPRRRIVHRQRLLLT